jgi:hypothetical protein
MVILAPLMIPLSAFAQETTYEDPIMGLQLEYPSSWKIEQKHDLIKFYLLNDTNDLMYYEIFATIHFFQPSLGEEMNTLDKFIRQTMSEIRSPSTQNISVSKDSTIGVNDLPAYKVESENVIENIAHLKSIRYFTIDNSTGSDTGYMISLNTENERLQEDVPLFEKMVNSMRFE